MHNIGRERLSRVPKTALGMDALSQSVTKRTGGLVVVADDALRHDLGSESDCQLYDMSKGSHRPFAAIILGSSVDYKVAADCEPSMHGDFVSG